MPNLYSGKLVSSFNPPNLGAKPSQPKKSSPKSESKIMALFQTVYSKLKYAWKCLKEIDNTPLRPANDITKRPEKMRQVVLTPDGFRFRLRGDENLIHLQGIKPEQLQDYLKSFKCNPFLKEQIEKGALILAKEKDILPDKKNPQILNVINSWKEGKPTPSSRAGVSFTREFE